MATAYIRKQLYEDLWKTLHGEPRLLQVVTGPRQVGKTTLALQIVERWPNKKLYESVDQPHTPDTSWISEHWKKARKLAKASSKDALLVLDEAQKIPNWSEAVKALIDEDRRTHVRLRVILLGSSALLVQRGLTESLAGRFELHRHPHWSYQECYECFKVELEDYLIFGGYPAGILMRDDFNRWARYIRDSIIESVISKDVLLMSPVQKPALLRQAFGMACVHPAEIISYQKMLGQLSDAGNTVTIAHYFHLLSAAYLMAALQRWSGSKLRRRGSIPKIILRNNALVNALMSPGFDSKHLDPTWRGRLVENAVGASLITTVEQEGGEVFYWRDRKNEIDFVIQLGKKLIGVEVKSGRKDVSLDGIHAFSRRHPTAEIVTIGLDRPGENFRGISLAEFFHDPQAILH